MEKGNLFVYGMAVIELKSHSRYNFSNWFLHILFSHLFKGKLYASDSYEVPQWGKTLRLPLSRMWKTLFPTWKSQNPYAKPYKRTTLSVYSSRFDHFLNEHNISDLNNYTCNFEPSYLISGPTTHFRFKPEVVLNEPLIPHPTLQGSVEVLIPEIVNFRFYQRKWSPILVNH